MIDNKILFNNSSNERFNNIVNFFKNNDFLNNFDRHEKIDFKDSKINKKILNLRNLTIVDPDLNMLEFLELKGLLDKDLIKPLYLS